MSVYLSDLDHALFFTLSYSDYFNFPLTNEEIYQRLPKVWDWSFLTGQKFTTDKLPVDKKKAQFEKSLKRLEDNQLIEKLIEKGTVYYFIKGRQQVLSLRINRKHDALKRINVINEASNWLMRFPTVRAVALTGSSALNNAALDDDLDFCLILKKNTLWISRFCLILLAKILNKQPQIDAQAKISNKQAWCFNMWLDESALSIVKRSSSIYQAYEIKQMRWLFDKNNYQQRLFSCNKQLSKLIDLKIKQPSCPKQKQTAVDYILWPINTFFYYLQSLYRCLLFGKENFFLTFYQAHFNESGRQRHIFQAIQRKMKNNAFSNF